MQDMRENESKGRPSAPVRFSIAKLSSVLSTWALRSVFHRPAENFPGKLGLVIDPHLINDLRTRLREGSVMVVGTNGKTTVSNLLANSFEAAGKTVACNRTGANLDSGIASALLHSPRVDWGVLECDELWLPKVAPQVQPTYIVLLNLFRDQLDRAGEIDHVQAAIADALAACPSTTLVYNADDPLCAGIAQRANNQTIGFGIGESLGLAQNTVVDASICQACGSALDYEWRQYGQLGSYYCPNCDFKRPTLDYSAGKATDDVGEALFTITGPEATRTAVLPINAPYMQYNVLALHAIAECCGLPASSTNEAIRSFDPRNGRLQTYDIAGHKTLLNLAKNPTGFNQNLRIITSTPGTKAVAFFINDKEADGHDVSWLWDVDFQELAREEDLSVFAGGIRRNDMQVRLKYAGIDAQLVDGAKDFANKAHAAMPDGDLFLIANYTALPVVKAELDEAADIGCASVQLDATPTAKAPATRVDAKLNIVHMYPELLNLYGDGGNVTILADRARRRGIDVDVVRVPHGQPIDLDQADIVFLGGGPDREQQLASKGLFEQADAFRSYVEDDGVILAICGGFQILGRTWLLGSESVPGLGIVDLETKRAPGGSHNRLVNNIALKSPLASMPVIGYENHAGRTFLGQGCKPLGSVVSSKGDGNNETDKADGVLYRNVVGTYLHGPLLAKNPEVADWLIERAIARQTGTTGKLAPIDDSVEIAANEFMQKRLGL